ncbi:hypothetical protein IJT10_07060 [bacterium]|nr:hypothetical protein [bacterium]
MTRRFRLKSRYKRYLIVGLFLLLFGLSIWLLMFAFSSAHKDSPFAAFLPKSTPFAIEGTPLEIKLFLRKRCGIAPNFINSIDPERDPNARVLVASLAYSQKESPLCQAHLLEIANSVEELWQKNKSYPQSLDSVTPCPLGGQLAYQNDKETFTLVCKGQNHYSLYNSRSGLKNLSPKINSKNLQDRPSKDQNIIEKERLAELNTHPRTAKIIADSSMDKIVGENTDPYRSTINADSELAQRVDNKNLPLPSSTLPHRFELKDPFIIVVANVQENLENFFTLKAHPQLQIWSPTPELAKNILEEETADLIDFKPLQDTDLQMRLDSSLAHEAIPCTKFLNLPPGTLLTLSKDQHHYEGELTLPPGSEQLYEKFLDSSANAQELLDGSYSSTAIFCFTEAFQDLCAYPIGGKLPDVWTISFDSSKCLNLEQIRFQFNKVLAGRASVDMCAQFANEKELEDWLKKSPWYTPEENTYAQIRGEGKNLFISAGQLPKLEEKIKVTNNSLPCVACGYFTLKEDSANKLYRFALGVPKNEEAREEKILWLSVDIPD